MATAGVVGGTLGVVGGTQGVIGVETGSAYEALVLSESSLLELWMLQEASGTSAAASKGTLGAATIAASGVTHRAAGPSDAIPYGLGFDGVDGEVELPTLTGLTNAAQT